MRKFNVINDGFGSKFQSENSDKGDLEGKFGTVSCVR